MDDSQPASEQDLKPAEPGGTRGVHSTTNGALPDPPGLEQQIAALAAQVRSLGQRIVGARSPSATIAPRLRETPPQATANGPGPADAPPTLPPLVGTEVSGARLLAMAEAAAAEIRANAELEAQRIREAIAADAGAHLNELFAIIARHSEGIATLIAEAERIEHDATTLRGHARVLEGELQDMLVAVSALARREH